MLGWLRVVTFAAVAALSTGAAVLSTGAVAQEQYQEGVHYDLSSSLPSTLASATVLW